METWRATRSARRSSASSKASHVGNQPTRRHIYVRHFRSSASTLAGARDIVIGFGLTTVVVLIVLALWRHSGVAGTVSKPLCKPALAWEACSMVSATASISLLQSFSANAPTAHASWKTKSDDHGHFHIDLPPGGYWLSAETNDGYGAGASLAVFDGRVTQIDLFLVRNISGGICLAATDRIATPGGPVPVLNVVPGMIVWTLDASGRRVAAPVLAVTHRPALVGQPILRFTLSDGRVVEASAGHPTFTGTRVGELVPGDLLDGSAVSSIEELPYAGATWDLLPAGATGAYWANDVLLGSTLSNGQVAVPSINRSSVSVSPDGATPSSSARRRLQSW